MVMHISNAHRYAIKFTNTGARARHGATLGDQIAIVVTPFPETPFGGLGGLRVKRAFSTLIEKYPIQLIPLLR